MYVSLLYTVFQKSDAKIQITLTTAYLIRIKYPLSSFNYHLSDVNVANFNKIRRTVSVDCDKTKKKHLSRFLYHTTDHLA